MRITDRDSDRVAARAVGASAKNGSQYALRIYIWAAVATFAITAVELLMVFGGVSGARLVLVPLMLVNFAVGALFYQGLWYEVPVHQALFGMGFLFGVLALFGLVILVGLGRIVRP